MTAARRWWIVGIGVLVLIASPVLVRALPVPDPDTSATALLAQVQGARAASWSGYVETAGNVALPENDALSGLTGLVGDTNRVRAWWRDPHTWRVATLRSTGETDLVHKGARTVQWVYESSEATTTPDVPVRLPTTVDLLPPELARRVLSGARPGELARIPARRVAGRDAPGLRLRPADRQSSVGRVDVYVDPGSGVPLRVDLFARGGRSPALTARFVDFTAGRPASAALAFEPPADARLRFDGIVDLAAAADRFAARVPPTSLAGLPQRQQAVGSAGVYGRGPTVLIAVPLWSRTSERIRGELQQQPGVVRLNGGLLTAADPLRLLLAAPEVNGTSWLLAGTVTEQALSDAADQLARDRPGLRGAR